MIDTAMVLAAGLGTRLREISGETPKPLVRVAQKPLIDWAFDLLEAGGIRRAVVNIHHKADDLERHLRGRTSPAITISDEREMLLETGGALVKATPHFQGQPIFCTNTDAIMRCPKGTPLSLLRERWDDGQMDGLLLLVPQALTTGYAGRGDFVLEADGRLSWEGAGPKFVYTGLQILHPRLWAGESIRPQSTKNFWDRAMDQGRLYGVVYEDRWMHVGDPAGFHDAERLLAGVV